jgi:hypothetical protein
MSPSSLALAQVIDVPQMKEVKTAVGKNDFLFLETPDRNLLF